MRVLVAGCGDLGTRAGTLLAAGGAQVFGLRRGGTLPSPLATIHADLRDAASLARAVPEAIDTLVHAATPDARTEDAYRATYVDGLRHAVHACGASLRRVVFVSSTAVYGDHDGAIVDEATPAEPVRYNGAVLRDAERWLAGQPVPGIALRLGGLYGPGRTQLLDRVAAGDVGCTPGQWTNRIHVDDAARAIAHVLALRDPAPCYAVVDASPALECEVVAWLARRLGVAAPAGGAGGPTTKPARDRAGGNRRVSSRRLQSSGFAFAYPDFRHGYEALIAAREAAAPPRV